MAMIQGGPNAKPPAPEKLTPDTPLSLSLLNLRTSGSLTDIRPFDLNQEIADSGGAPGGEGAAAANGAGTGNVNTAPVGADTTNAGAGSALNSDISLSNLKQLGQALKDYAQDNNATLPPMQDMSAVKQALMPYLKDEAKFTNPRTNEPYQINTILTQHKVGHIINPTEMVTFYEATPGPDNTRGFVTLDGQVHRAPETEWPLWKKRSKML